jgi:hypothetical protein
MLNGEVLAENNLASITNSIGNIDCLQLPNNMKTIGSQLTNTDDIIIFATDDQINHEIGLFDPNSCEYTTIVNAPCLEFNTKYPVFSLFRIRNGCERTIYFTDRNNNYRVINLDTPTVYQDLETQDFDCDLFALTRQYTVPTTVNAKVNDFGGFLDLGSVQFSIRYLDRDLNPTNFIYAYNPINIYDEPTTTPYLQINGGTNIQDTADPTPGDVPQTSKSITLTIDNLDTSFTYFQLVAMHASEGVGAITETWLLKEQAISSEQAVYVYSGPSVGRGDTQIPLNEVQVDLEPIEVVHDHAQKDDTLWLANLSSSPKDWSEFQRFASLVDVEYVVEQSQLDNVNSQFDPKNPTVNFDDRSLPGDEIISLAIEYLTDAGTWTPAFHIPGRPPTVSDTAILTVINGTPLGPQVDFKDVAHLGLNIGDTVERWKVFNTASNPVDNAGTMGYHQTNSTTYQDIRDCEGFSIWGTDSSGNNLAGTPIRHHRVPNRRVIPTKEGDLLNAIGLRFSNIQYPDPSIVGHRFLIAERTEFNSTVVDQGILVSSPAWDEGTTQEIEKLFFGCEFNSTDDNPVGVFISPKTLVLPGAQSADYFFINGFYDKSQVNVTESEGTINVEGGGNNNDYEVFGDVFDATDTDLTIIPDVFNRNILSNIIVSPRSSQNGILTFTDTIINNSYSNTHNVHRLGDPVANSGVISGFLDVTLKRIRDPYSNLDVIIYFPLKHDRLTLADDQVVFGGNNSLTKLDYIDINKIELDSDVIIFGDENDIDMEHFFGIFVDSTINYSLRHGGTNNCDAIYRYNEEQWEYVRRKVFTTDDNGTTYSSREIVCPETYFYNFDYSLANTVKPKFPLSTTFDYCSNCVNNKPYRIRYSKQSYQEEVTDNYKIFSALNYHDLDGSTGDINALVIDKDELYALTNTVWFIPTRPQTIQSSESTIYLGTGERLSIPPKRMISSNHIYGGTKFKHSVVNTEFGTFYADSETGKVFKLSNSIEEISSEGLKAFFRSNLKLKLNELFKAEGGIEYPIQTTTHTDGIGIMATYDPIHQNYILTKKDYDVLDQEQFEIVNTLGEVTGKTVVYNKADQSFYSNRSQLVKIDWTNKQFFQDKSFTIAYSIPAKSWSSFFSYLPSYMFHNEDTFFSVNDSVSIWEHNSGPYQEYYGTKYPFIVDTIAVKTANGNNAPVDSDNFFANQFVMDVTQSESPIQNKFFDQVIFYNTHQSSGLKDIEVNDTEFFSPSGENISATRVDREWNLSGIEDMVINRSVPLFSDNWIFTQNQYPIDKVVNPFAIDVNKNLFSRERFRDQYLGARYYFNNDNNYRMNLQFILTKSQNSIR